MSGEMEFLDAFVYICAAVLAVFIFYYTQHCRERLRYRFESFSPVRNNSRAKWFIDGQDYMSAVADAIESAKDEIMITDWQMNPEIFLKRPDSGIDSSEWRLDKMLLRKADKGVRVYILLYHETAIDLGSNRTRVLLGQHKNIEVHRHPDNLAGLKTLFRWSHHEKMVIVDRSVAFVGGIDLCFGRWDTRNHELTDDYLPHPSVVYESESPKSDQETNTKYARWIGKDYRNAFYNNESETDWEKPFADYEGFDRKYIPRMPWHDVACAFTGDVVMDAVKHFVQRYNALKPWSWVLWASVHQLYESSKSKTEQVFLNSDMQDVSIQVLRSVDNWSAGQPLEVSIQNAYIHAIENAKHFIYIENQFFISSQEGFWIKARNKIQSALVDRIVRAHEASEDFHVMVITPLKPEFSGQLDSDDWSSDALRAVTRWNQVTIFHGEDSLFNKLEKRNIPKETAEKYFSVYSLRTLGLLKGYFITEIVYVHSKVMIVDDRLTIIGSANINDRSMLGERDSEVAVIIEDTVMVDGKMNGRPYQFGKFSHSLRCDLLKEHLGSLGQRDDGSEIVNDPLATDFLQGVEIRAKLNTAAYMNAFVRERMITEGPRTEEIDEDFFQKPLKETGSSRESLQEIKGNLVTYPSHILAEKLKPSNLDFIHLYVNRKIPPKYEPQILWA